MAITSFFKRNWIHFTAIGIFLIVGLVYFNLQLKGYGLKQHDIQQYIGASHEIVDFREQNGGQEPLWTNSMFGGMPATQISMIHEGNWFSRVISYFTLTFPSPMGIVLLYMLGFYMMLNMMKINKWLAIFGSLTYAFLSYQIIILQAGHNSKAIAVAFMAPVVGAFIMAYRRNWIFGTILSALFMTFEMASNHLQVTYYLIFLLFGLGIAEFVRVFKTKAFMPFLKATVGIVAGYLLAFVINYGNIGMTNEYAKQSMRGKNDLTIAADGTKNAASATEGLDVDYITQYSYGIDESFTFVSPYIKGGASEKIGGSPFAEKIASADNVDPKYLASILSVKEGEGVNAYWGNQLSTSGPVYLGVILCFLALLGMVYIKDASKWALLGVSIIVLMLSWGKNYIGFTEWFLENVPAYNKFRAVTIILVIIELTIPLLAVMFVDKLIKEREAIKANIKPFFITAAAFFVFMVGMKMVGIDKSYLSDQENDATAIEAQLNQQRAGIYEQIKQLTPEQAQQYGIDLSSQATINAAVESQIESMRTNYNEQLAATQEARKVIFNTSMNRSILFTVLAIACLFLFFRTSVPVQYSLGALGLIAFIDVAMVSNNYLNNNEDDAGNYKYWSSKLSNLYPMSTEIGDIQILQNEMLSNPLVKKEVEKAKTEGEHKANELEAIGAERSRIVDAYMFSALNRSTNYRVFGDENNNVFNSTRTSYFHKSVGGYHGAKLRSIQNMIEFHIGRSNNNVLNMFNVKYFLQPTDSGLVANPNPQACGNAWFVKRAQIVPTADDEILALGSKFSMKNIGTGKFIVNGKVQQTINAFGSEKLQYLPVGSRDTIAVPLSNGIPLGVEVVFVQDTTGKTDLIMKQGFVADSTKSFIGFVEFKVTDEFNPKEEAIILNSEAKKLKGKQWKGDGDISLIKYAPNKLIYQVNAKSGGLAVFSEVFYPEGWSATIDGKPADIIKVNYLLRGLDVPSGKHTIEFAYMDEHYIKYNNYAMFGSLILLILAGFGVYMALKMKKTSPTEA